MNTLTIEIPSTEPSDEALMARLSDHEPESLKMLYKRYAAVLRGVVMRVVHDEAETEDVLQDIFVQVWDRADHYEPAKGKPLGWLVTLARRRAIDRLRQRSAYRRATDRFEFECRVPHDHGDSREFDQHIFEDDLRRILLDLIGNLPPYQREVIMLTFFKGMSQREIAAATRIPLGTIKTRIELGMRKLSTAMRAIRRKVE